MKTLVALPLLLAAAPLAAPRASGPEIVSLVHRMPERRTVEVRLQQTERMEVVDETWCPTEDGRPLEGEAENTGVEVWSSTAVDVRFDDRYGAVEDGRLQSLERSFVSLDAPVEGRFESDEGEEDLGGELSSPLVGHAVVFRWEPEEDDYRARFDGDDEVAGEEILLAGMDVDAFGDWYLPDPDEAELEPGATWDAGVEAWHSTLDIGGDFWIGDGFDPDVAPETVEERRSIRSQLRSGGEGACTCTFTGTREEDGATLAVIEIDLEVRVEAEHEATFDDMGGASGAEGASARVRTTITMDIEATGTCLWDVEAGLPRSIELDARWESVSLVVDETGPPGELSGGAWRSVTENESTIRHTYVVAD